MVQRLSDQNAYNDQIQGVDCSQVSESDGTYSCTAHHDAVGVNVDVSYNLSLDSTGCWSGSVDGEDPYNSDNQASGCIDGG